jgi:hypothetical protein
MQKKEYLYLSIAGFILKIHFKEWDWEFASNILRRAIKKHYKGFILQTERKKIDFQITIVETEKFYFSKRKNGDGFINFFHLGGKRIITYYQISILQFQIIIRQILLILLSRNNGFILHGSANIISNKASLYLGKSGAGKSTVMKLLKDYFPPTADDTLILRRMNGKWGFFQSPFIEKEHWIKKNKKGYQIKGIFFLKKAKCYKIVKITNKPYVLKRICTQLWTLDEIGEKQLKETMRFISEFDAYYILHFGKRKKRLYQLLQ